MDDAQLLDTWEKVDALANQYGSYWRVPYFQTAFRGHSKTWNSLLPSLARRVHGNDRFDVLSCRTVERIVRDELLARCSASTLDELTRANWLGQAAVVRHFGAPARVLDWSQSPFVALYFACADDMGSDGELWFVSAHEINAVAKVATMYDGSGDEVAPWFDSMTPEGRVAFVRPGRHSARSAAQQCLFSVSDDPRADHRGLIEDALRKSVHHETAGWEVHGLHRLIVPANVKEEFLKKLWHRNVHAASLFPDLEGLCRYANDLVALYSFGMKETHRKVDEIIASSSRRNASRRGEPNC